MHVDLSTNWTSMSIAFHFVSYHLKKFDLPNEVEF